MESYQIKLKESSIFQVPLYSYERDFTFIVNGEEYKTSRIISDLISPKICQFHLFDPTVDTFTINTHSKGDFSLFLNLAKFRSYSIPSQETDFVYEVLKILENEFIECDVLNDGEIDINNVLPLLQIHEKNVTFYSKLLTVEIDFASLYFNELIHNYENELLMLTPSTIERILNNEKLQIEDEDQLVSFINKLYKKDGTFSYLYESVIFSNLSDSKIIEFLELFDIENINQKIWKSLTNRMKKQGEKLTKNRYSKINTQNIDGGLLFKFEDKNSFNGIFNYIKNKTNNRIGEVVKITSSSEESFHFKPENAILLPNQQDYFASKCIKDSWICFEFKNNKVVPSCYTIGSTINSFRIKSWAIEGSNDNENWEMIDSQKNCFQMNVFNYVDAFKISNDSSKKFRFIRLRMTGPNWSNNEYLRLNSFELYGSFY